MTFIHCPKCQSERIAARNTGRKAGGAIGTVAGAVSGAAGGAVGASLDSNVLGNYECLECGHSLSVKPS